MRIIHLRRATRVKFDYITYFPGSFRVRLYLTQRSLVVFSAKRAAIVKMSIRFTVAIDALYSPVIHRPYYPFEFLRRTSSLRAFEYKLGPCTVKMSSITVRENIRAAEIFKLPRQYRPAGRRYRGGVNVTRRLDFEKCS